MEMEWRGVLPSVYLLLASSLSHHIPQTTGPWGIGKGVELSDGNRKCVNLTLKIEPRPVTLKPAMASR